MIMKRVLIIIAAALVFLFAAASVATAAYTNSEDSSADRLPDNISINGVDVSGKSLDEAKAMFQSTREKHIDDVLVVGNSCWYYLLTDRKTENRYFYQLPPLEISASLRGDFYEELLRKPSDCIILPGCQEDRNWMNEALGGLRSFLEAEGGYQRENYDDFEVYFRSSIK